MLYHVDINGRSYRLELVREQAGWRCRLDGRTMPIDAVLAGRDRLSLLIEGKSYEIKRERSASDMYVWVGSAGYAAEVRDPRSLRARQGKAGEQSGPRKLVASMPGRIVRVLVEENAQVDAGQGIVVVEAMKMQNEIKSPKQGRVQKLMAREGANVNAGDVLAIVE
jgi:biotin carboxyl carrier protein